MNELLHFYGIRFEWGLMWQDNQNNYRNLEAEYKKIMVGNKDD